MSDQAGDRLPPEAQAAQAPSAGVTGADEHPSFIVRSRLGFGLAVALLLVFATVIGSHWPAFTGTGPQATPANPSVPAPPAQPKIAEARPQAQSSPAIGPAGNPASFTDLATRLGGVEARLNAVENVLARAADRDVQTALQGRVARLESESSGEALRRAGSVLALATLARAAGEARPFKPQLDAMAALSPGDPAVKALALYADVGVPTMAMLAARFPGAASIALDAERVAARGNGLLARLWSSITGLIRVRRIGDVTGATTADKLARAEADLSRGDLYGAIMETRSVAGPAALELKAWLLDAQNRAAIDGAIGDMEKRVVEAIAAPAPRQVPLSTAARDAPAGP
jgi:hypothetical protein